MFSPVWWNLLSALKIMLNFSCYAKFSFPHCSKVTRASQEKKMLMVFKVNEGHPSSTVCQSICFLSGLFFFFLTSHLHPLDLPISLSASNLTEIKAIFPWAVSVFFLCFLKPFIYSPLAPTRGRDGRPIPPRLLMQHPPEMLLKSPLPRPCTINYPVTSL